MNILLALLGWLAFNLGVLVLAKDPHDDKDEDFSYRKHAKKNIDNWVFNLVIALCLIIFGIKGLGLDAIPIDDFKHLHWNDAYYAASGFAGECVLRLIKKLRNNA